MALCGLIALVVGFLAGLRFRVMIVIPIELMAGAVAAALVVAGQASIGQACLGFGVAGLAVQVGYGLALACPLPTRAASSRGPLKA